MFRFPCETWGVYMVTPMDVPWLRKRANNKKNPRPLWYEALGLIAFMTMSVGMMALVFRHRRRGAPKTTTVGDVVSFRVRIWRVSRFLRTYRDPMSCTLDIQRPPEVWYLEPTKKYQKNTPNLRRCLDVYRPMVYDCLHFTAKKSTFKGR